MNSWLFVIAQAVCSPFAFLIGAIMFLITMSKTLEPEERVEYRGWPPSPKDDTRVFHPQKAR
jgi:hypothetical protein